jgi:signal transduction histidine kinase
MQTLDGEPVFRYIKALYIESACLQCHCYQGYQKGQLRGCLSVIIPSAAAQARIAGLHRSLLCDGGLIILLILLVLVLLNHFLTVRPLKRLNRQVRKFERDVNAVVHPLPRSDELGTLSHSLAQMSQTIRDQHKSMEKRVERATENLRRVNRELVEANRSLKQQDALKTDFLATVSHELRTPLTTIRGGVDYLLQTISDPDQQGYLRLLERNIENLVEMVNNLIDLARIDLRRIELEIEEIDLKALLEDVIILFAAGAEEKGIGIAARGELPRVVIEGDYRRLNQIFMNLVHNAVKFSPAGQQVEVELVEREEKVEIRIIDHGIGITPEEIEEIFTRYRFGHQGGERVGSGLGLAIARGLVEAHGGILKVTSQPGVETVFTVILPRRQREEGDGEKT